MSKNNEKPRYRRQEVDAPISGGPREAAVRLVEPSRG